MTFPVYADLASNVLGVYFTSFAGAALNFFAYLSVAQVSLLGDHMPGVPPVPIPNTAVKP